MKKFFLILSALFCCIATYAQAAAELTSGYYRVHNYGTDRYIHVTDDKGSYDIGSATVDMNAIRLYKGLDHAVSDPASVLYVQRVGAVYDITAQGTGIHQMISTYLNLMTSPRVDGAYYAYGKKGSVVMYLYDARSNTNYFESWLSTTGKEEQRNWFITPVDANTDNYFGVAPTITANGKYYQPFYCSFPFSAASSGLKFYYVSFVDETKGCVVYKQITGTVPANTPVFIECSSDQPVNNKLNVGGKSNEINDNKLVGVFFESTLFEHENLTPYDASVMRSLGITSEGKLGLIKGNYENVPRNHFYLPVSKNAPAEFKLVTEEEYENMKEPIMPTGITLSSTSLSITVGQSQTLTATIQPADATVRDITWSSSNTAVATVDANGKITAVSVGSATITAKVGDVSATCQVTVTPIMATSVTLSATSLDLKVGESSTLSATVVPDNTSDKTIIWSSSNTAVATVDNNGKVTAKAPGTATITAKCGNVSATCQVNVTAIEATSVTLNKTSLELLVGATETLTATVAPDNTTYKTVTWTSSNTAVATVNDQGVITAVGAGQATITATCGNVSATCQVTVKIVEVESVSLNRNTLELTIGATEYLVATVNPSNATDKTLTWSSSNESVATVSNFGKVTAIAVGEATITVTCGGKSATCQVTVKPIEAESVKLNHTYLTMHVGDVTSLTATVSPEETTDKTVTWTSSDSSVASVDTEGNVTAVSVGSAKITATCGNVSATCSVNVKPVEASGISLDTTSATVYPGETFELVATVSPENTTDKTVTWTSSNDAVATVDGNGKVTAVAPGDAVITAKCGNVSATCIVSVLNPNAESVRLNTTKLDLVIGETAKLEAEVLPETTVDKNIVWSSSDESIATVSEDGTVVAIALGTAVITASCGDITATCEVTVKPIEATSVTLDRTEVELLIGATDTLVATVAPDDTTDKTIVWSSSDEAVVAVDQDGNITAIAVGEATVTAACGNVLATCNVTVKPILAEEVTLDKTDVNIKIDETVTLTATVTPDNVTDKTVVWSTSDATVAVVDADGNVTGVSEGTAEITAACGDAAATCVVTVTAEGGISDIIIDADSSFDVYNVQGMKVRGNTNTLSGLPKGVYIVNGNKYYVR